MKHLPILLTLFLLAGLVGIVSAETNISPVMTSNDAPGTNHTYATSEYTGGIYQAYRAYDNNPSTRYSAAGVPSVSVPQNITINMSYQTVIGAYGLTPMRSSGESMYKNWDLYGSNDNITYTRIDSHYGYTTWSGTVRSNFTITNSQAFSYYRFRCNATGDGKVPEIVEIDLYGEYLSPPVVSFTANATSGYSPLTIQLTDTSTGAPTSWAWGVNNVTGNNTWVLLGTGQNITPTFGVGNWSINLTATNLAGSDISDQITYVNVSAPPTPTVSFSATPTTGVNPLTVSFNDTTTSEIPITSYNVSFGDGSWLNQTTFPATNITHLYSTSGNYTVDWYVSNAEGTGSASTTITVWGAVHSAFSMFNAAGTAPHTTYLYDASTNLTPGPVTYLTDFGEENTSTEANTYFTWNATGTYNVTHTVSNGLSSETSFTTVTVGTPTPPVVAPVASFYGSPTTGNVPLTVSFTDVSSNIPTSWFWEFGDGTNSTLQNPTHAYTRSGFKNVNLTATNSAGSNITVRLKFVRVS